MKSFVRFVSLSAFLVASMAQAESSRNCATVEQLKKTAEQQIVASYQRLNGVACVSQSVDFSAGDAVRDTYKFVYACKLAREGTKVTLLRVTYRDAEVRPFKCSELTDFDVTQSTEVTDREF